MCQNWTAKTHLPLLGFLQEQASPCALGPPALGLNDDLQDTSILPTRIILDEDPKLAKNYNNCSISFDYISKPSFN